MYQGIDTGDDLPDIAKEMLLIVSEQVEPAWVQSGSREDVLMS